MYQPIHLNSSNTRESKKASIPLNVRVESDVELCLKFCFNLLFMLDSVLAVQHPCSFPKSGSIHVFSACWPWTRQTTTGNNPKLVRGRVAGVESDHAYSSMETMTKRFADEALVGIDLPWLSAAENTLWTLWSSPLPLSCFLIHPGRLVPPDYLSSWHVPAPGNLPRRPCGPRTPLGNHWHWPPRRFWRASGPTRRILHQSLVGRMILF